MSGTIRGCVAGGIATAKKTREDAFRRYELNPPLCGFCLAPIALGTLRPCEAKKKKFCNRSCAASYNNPRKDKKLQPTCAGCSRSISSKAKFCVKCVPRTARTLDIVTKGEIFAKSKYWVQGAAAFRRHARRAYLESGFPLTCMVCDYKLHVEVAHIRDVADFPPEAKVEEVNSLSNLVALCPNHHWEFDNGHLTLPHSML